MDIKEYIRSQSFRGIIIGIAIAVIVLLIFQAGVFVGYRKASFAYKFGDNYYRAFDRRSPMPFGFPLNDEFRASHGAVGEVMSINLPILVVAGPDSVEKTVLITEETRIREFDTDIKAEDLRAGNFIVVLGDPNEDSQIQAKLIRVLPPPPEGGAKMIIRSR